MNRNPTARLFVAVDPPEDVRDALASWGRSAARVLERPTRPGASLRVLDPELLHVTLCFLGDRPVGELDALGAQLSACVGTAGPLALGAPLWLPVRRPRALAVELHDDEGWLASLQREAVLALQQVSDWESRESALTAASATSPRRRFRPHVTVLRMRRGEEVTKPELPPTPSLSFVPSELILYRSWLSAEGASYEALARHPIG